MNLKMGVVGRDLIERLTALLATPSVASDTVRAHVQTDALTGFESLTALVATKRTLLSMLEENVQFHVTFPIELPWTMWTIVVDRQTSLATASIGIVLLMLLQLVGI